MLETQIALNMESVQDRCAGTRQIVETLGALRDWGYRAVEILHCLNPDGGSTWREILDANGMRACATHELFDDILADPDRFIRKAKELGCTYVSAGLAQSVTWEDAESVKKLASDLGRVGRRFRDAGVRLLYHNHNMEFAKIAPDKNCLQYIFEETDPLFVGAELDAYWVQLSGQNPAQWCKALGGRLKALHLKDLCVTGGTREKYIKTPLPSVLGGGNMDIPGIVRAAEEVGCPWFIVETHANWVDGDSVKTAGLSFRYLLEHCR